MNIVAKLKKLWYGDNSNKGPETDQHADENAEIGDERYIIRPYGELFGYDKEHHRKRIELYKQTYKQNATFKNGKKSYGWRHSKTIFRGTVEEWEKHKNNPEKYRETIPVDWDDIVDHMDNFIEMNGEYIYRKEYPHSVLEID